MERKILEGNVCMESELPDISTCVTVADAGIGRERKKWRTDLFFLLTNRYPTHTHIQRESERERERALGDSMTEALEHDRQRYSI